MFRREFDNKNIDAIGRRLVENDLMSDDEIDRIIVNPDLFGLVNRRIATFEPAGRTVPVSTSRLIWFTAAAGTFASLAIIAFLAITFINKNGVVETAKPASKNIQVPDAAPDIARSDVPPKTIPTKTSADRAFISDDTGVRPEKASYQRPVSRVPNVSRRSASLEQEATFYPVAYTGDPAETAGGGRIIRVELNRSALFALGVDVPLENDRATVKADLLVGMDGVTRAVRLVE